MDRSDDRIPCPMHGSTHLSTHRTARRRRAARAVVLPAALTASLLAVPLSPLAAQTEPVGDDPCRSAEASDSARGDAPPCPDDEPVATVSGEIIVSAGFPTLATEERLPGDRLEATGASDLVAALREMPGLSGVRRGPINLEPAVRGLQEDQVASLVDGTRTFAAGPGRMDSNLSHVGPHMLEGVQVVKGPYALTWGAGALSAIDARTRRGAFHGDGLELTPRAGVVWNDAGGASGDGVDAWAGVDGGTSRVRFAVDLGHRTGDDYEAGDGSLVPGDFQSSEARLRLGWQASDALVLDLGLALQDQDDIDYPGRLLNAIRFDTRSYVLGATWSGAEQVESVEAQLYANRKDHRMTNDGKPTAMDMPGRVPPFALDVDLPTESNTTGGRVRTTLRTDADAEWVVGVDGYRIEQNASRTIARRSDGRVLFTDIVWPDASIEDLGAFAQWTARRGAVRYGGAMRFDAVDASAGEVSPFFRQNVAGDLDQSETHVSAAVDAGVELGGGWSLRAGLGSAVRTATATERYSDRFPATRFQIAAEFLGNPALDPERSIELDAGLRYASIDGAWIVRLDGFVRQLEDHITIVADPSVPKRLPLSPPTVFRYINGDRAETVGAELVVDHRPSDRWSWRGDVSWLRGDDEELDEPLLGMQPLTVRLAARVAALRDRLWLDAGVRWTDDQDRVAVSRFEQPTEGATVLSAGAEWLVSDGLTLDLDVDNLTDESYADHLDAPNPFTGQRILAQGRTLRVGLRWQG
ncbi:MAG: TonB-dependent receptor [Acidobacteriota bacterium]